MNIVRVPRSFYDDHNERGLPAPDPVKESKLYVWIDRDHPDVPELVSDAQHYSWSGWSRDDEGMKSRQMAARRLLKALGRTWA